MPNLSTTTPAQPLDLSVFLNDDADASAPVESQALVPANGPALNPTAPTIEPMPPMERLVDLASLTPEQRAKAQSIADGIRFDDTVSTLSFIDHTLQPMALVSRQLLSDTTVGEAGEVGRIAAAVIDGIKILRIEELQAEAHAVAPRATGFLSKVMGMGRVAHGALKSFQENRKTFLDLMDKEEARARKTKGDLMTTVQLLDQQKQAVRQGVSDLSIAIAAAQIALDRGVDEAEGLRQTALRTNTAGDAALAMDHRNTLANFRGQIADLREAMISAAALIPLIASNRKAAETRITKLNSGIMLTLPRLMTVASQAVVQADVRRAGEESAKLDEAARRITELAGQGAHDAAVDAARSLAGDPRNLDSLIALSNQTIATMQEVLEIEAQVAQQDREREQQLIVVRNKLVEGMRGVQAKALARPVQGA